MRACLRLAAAALLAATATVLPAQSTLTLSDAERQTVLDSNTEASVARAQSGIEGVPSVDRKVHGEMGVMIGTGGARGIYGAADIPLGDHAGATVMFEDTRYGNRRW